MERLKQQREQPQHGQVTEAAGVRHRGPEKLRLSASWHNNWPLFSSIAVITASLILGTGQELAAATVYELPVHIEGTEYIETLPPPAAGHAGRQESAADTSRQATTGKIARPVTASVVTVDPPPLVTPVAADPRTPASASLGTDTPERGPSGSPRPSGDTPEKAAALDRQEPVTRQQPAPWVINLVSSTSKSDANRMAEKARSMDIQTEQQQVTVKGTQYWRVQITGFSTRDEARAYSGTAREKLGLKDVWILKR